ncbi:FAD-dependent oxidoreductase [Simiduia aestuariiviva]|uniref:Glycerol-3-phosphate dehydrogenase n=1 Tax=Simiduia aestuariiviva TaxID=1510459 RepID=A0A839UN39_9GAMM|nr:FAD-dependent oxidoreductase [Simiduia aestuariiviva]MBB3166867.1 glycerol-3-phosphate dehydrogenase [Simiduia aestuariiviva]
MSEQQHHFDTLIIGGGIAGLWLANRLQSAGYNLLLLEQSGLGDQQSMASQGMIHGGVKYALSGALTGASEAIADMPAHWAACLKGEGDVDLRGAQVLSQHFYMWASQSVTSRITTFFASKALRGRVDSLKPDQYPPLLAAAGQSFDLYKLVDVVLDVPSVIEALARNLSGRTRTIDWQHAHLEQGENGISLAIEQNGERHRIHAKKMIFTAGRGNEALLAASGCQRPAMQLRPLQQVMVKHDLGYEFYGHCLGADKTPRLTISSHPARDGDTVWYLGGSLAEQGATQSPAELITTAQSELAALMPWLDFTRAEWATLPIARAEPRQRNFARPDQAFAARAQRDDGAPTNILVGWPTKLTLAPNMANSLMALLQEDGIEPSGQPSDCEFLPPAPLAHTPWDSAFNLIDETPA